VSTTVTRPPAPTRLDDLSFLDHLSDVELDTRARRADRVAGDGLIGELEGVWPPAGLVEATEAGPVLAALVNTVSLPVLDAERLVEVAAGAARLVSWATAREVAATAALTSEVASFRGVGPRADEVSPEVMAAAELGAGLTLSPTAARWRVELAQDLERLPLTRIALAAGRIDLARARAVVEAVAGLDEETARAVEAKVMGRAPTQTTAACGRACAGR